ncbi:hypothetical protein GH714_031057 [Hevea brasiliensis]|uniref:Uncharacterized protein n=1 Tax=Hevea brasiliensis TaxID=3981 RepID=A0A6A6LCT3_HEVBR|nr:hypothetical protein GH714_031057 [Hevea brasiliensis]
MGKRLREQGLDLQTGSFTLRQLRAAANNFDSANKIGEDGFGSVCKELHRHETLLTKDGRNNAQVIQQGHCHGLRTEIPGDDKGQTIEAGIRPSLVTSSG